jgi:hypothetical protein
LENDVSLFRKTQLMKEEGPESKIEQLCRERERGNLIKEG